MATIEEPTERQRSAYDLVVCGVSLRKAGVMMGISHIAVRGLTIKAIKGGLTPYNKGDKGLEQAEGEIPLPQHAFKDPKTIENWQLVQNGGYFERVSWQPKPYNLQEWRIDTKIVPTVCSYCKKQTHTHWQGGAAWCEDCGRWFDGLDVGRQEE